ncbi:MAG: hypothetical protein NTX01_03130 [Candidatus Omnitrophica bacterium]|nr:hypothetical protein [Candidatus Omnitrophota bacterium]
MEKPIRIVVGGSGVEKDLMISPGATVAEVTEEAGLRGYQLARKGEKEPLAPETDLFKEAADSETFYASPSKVEVGGGGSASLYHSFDLLKTKAIYLLDRIKRWFQRIRNRSPVFKKKRVVVIRTRIFRQKKEISRAGIKVKVIYKETTSRLVVKGKKPLYWQKSGWLKRGRDYYEGFYKTYFGKWRGSIRENYKGNYSFYISDPPDEVLDGEHGVCFFFLNDTLYFVHFKHEPNDISSGIMAVEKVISNSFKEA